MLRRLIIAFAASMLAVPAQAQAPEPPAGLVWMVVSELNRIYDDVDDPTNRPPLVTAPPEGVLTSLDIDQDGVGDWMLRWPQESWWCGTGGCRVTLYLSRDGGLRRVFDRQTFSGLRVTAQGGAGQIEGAFHPLMCVEERDTCRLAWRANPGSDGLEPVAAAPGGPDTPAQDAGPIETAGDRR